MSRLSSLSSRGCHNTPGKVLGWETPAERLSDLLTATSR